MGLVGKGAAAVAVATFVALGAACGDDEERSSADAADDEGHGLSALVRDPAPDVGSVTLPDATQAGEPFTFVADEGEVLLAYFGFTSCPDVCPTTLADVRTALADLGDAAERVDLAMVSIDPEVDTPERLRDYVGSFVPGAHALTTTDPDALVTAADAFGASYGREPAAGAEEGEVFHSTFLYAVDDEGLLQATWSFGAAPDDIAADLRLLLDR